MVGIGVKSLCVSCETRWTNKQRESMPFFEFIVRRTIYSIFVIVIISLLAFILLRAIPGSPIDYYKAINPLATEDIIKEMERKMGLDKPLHEQYLIWVGQLVRGDFGTSLSRPGQPVWDTVKDRMLNSLILALSANFLSILIAIPLGITAAVHRNSILDSSVRTLSLFGYSMPSFWLAILLIYIFAVKLGWFPTSRMFSIVGIYPTHAHKMLDLCRHMVLPVVVLGAIGAGSISRFVRSSMLEVLNEDYIRTARAKGLSELVVIYKHALRNSLRSVVTIIGLQIGHFFSSAAVTETVFAWPGIGREVVLSTITRDYPMVMAITLITGAIFILINFVVDVLYAVLDPRVKF